MTNSALRTTPSKAPIRSKGEVAWRGIRVQFEVIPIPDRACAWQAPHFPTDTRRQEQSLTGPCPLSRTSVAGLPSDDFVPLLIGTSIRNGLETSRPGGPVSPWWQGGRVPQRCAGAMSGSMRFGSSPWPKQGGAISNNVDDAYLLLGIGPKKHGGCPNILDVEKKSYLSCATRDAIGGAPASS
jgi:hypothetical protein